MEEEGIRKIEGIKQHMDSIRGSYMARVERLSSSQKKSRQAAGGSVEALTEEVGTLSREAGQLAQANAALKEQLAIRSKTFEAHLKEIGGEY